MRIYLDTSPVICAVEQVSLLMDEVDRRLSSAGVVRVASSLTRMECRVKPLRDGNAALLQDYDDFFGLLVDEMVPLTDDVLDEATSIRARYGFKTPDAIHLAAATRSVCDLFLTSDRQLARFTGLAVDVVGFP